MRAVLCSMITSAVVFTTAVPLNAAVMDITLVPGQNNDIEVRLRTDQNFNEVFSALVFTVRWSNSSGANLGNVQQIGGQQDVMNINTSGPEQVEGDYRYQPFVGFGFSLLGDVGFSFSAGQEYVICNIPVLNAVDVFTIVNDPWTSANNADYYVSLNGSNATGIIYDTSTRVEQGPALAGHFSVWPNPADERITVSIAAAQGDGPVELELVGVSGELILRSRMQLTDGKGSRELDLSGVEAAVYVLRARSSIGACVVPVVRR